MTPTQNLNRSRTPRLLPCVVTRISAAALVALSVPAAAGDTVQFTDGWFGGTWNSAKIVDTTSGSAATFASVTNDFDGLPVPCRETTHNYDAGAIVVAHVDASATYDPADGAICTIDGAYDLIHYTAPNGAVRYRLLIVQDGTYYHHTAGTDVFANAWAAHVVQGLTPNAFSRVFGSGPEVPDFSCAGGPMFFGFTTSNSASTGPNTKVSSIDNWSITLNLARMTFTDGDFSPYWPGVTLFEATTPAFGLWVGTVSGANPGAGFMTVHLYDQGAAGNWQGRSDHSHDPSQAPVYELSYAFDARSSQDAPFAMTYHLAVRQGGQVFIGPPHVTSSAWTTYTGSGLLSSHFVNYPGGSPLFPDFSEDGAPFELGVVTTSSFFMNEPWASTGMLDNWMVRLELSPRCQDVVGTAYCFGDGSGPACPCHPAVPHGGAGRGCPNSLFPGGAKLIAQGSPSLFQDTLTLRASGMPNSSCLYFQGTAPTAVVAFDGLRCASGSVVRLGNKNNVCNASEYPSWTDLRISTRGGIGGPGTFYYQAWYRNAAAFCTSATANMTNGVAVAWGF